MSAFGQDLRYGVRTLSRDRQFTAVAVLILALGVGAATAIFSVVNAVLLRPLPYVEPDRLVAISSVRGGPEPRTSPTIALTGLAAWRPEARSVASMGAFAYTQLPVRVGDRAYSPITALVDPEFLATLGNPLGLGSQFDSAAGPGADRTAIISHALWTEAFGADPAAIGRAIVVDGEPYTLRGVLAPDFQFPRSDASYFGKPIALIIPASTFANFPADTRQWFGIARLGPEATREQAEAELSAIAGHTGPPGAPGEPLWTVRLTPLHDATTGASRQSLLTVLGIALVLLLVAATNLMNLFFSRGVTRIRELSIRRALGSTSGRIVRQLLAESLVLAAAGCAGGVLLAWFGIDALVAISPLHLPVTQAVGIDRTVLAFSVLIGTLATLTAAVMPALRVAGGAGGDRVSGTRVSLDRGLVRQQRTLCVVQIGLGLALLSAAGLLAHSLWRLNTVDPGFARAQVVGFNLAVPTDKPMAARQQFYARALDEIRAIPGVEQAGMISFLPPETRAGVFMPLTIDGQPDPAAGAAPRIVNTLVSGPGYFATMEMAVRQGRDFLESDDAAGRPVVIVNEALVRRHFADGDPVGQRIGTGFDGGQPLREIVGVISDAHDRGLAREAYPTAYVPWRQFALPYTAIALRTQAAATVIPEVRARLTKLDRSVPMGEVETVDERIRQSLREPRFYTVLALTCATMAVVFVALGLYGLVSYSVSRRTPEFGIRMAVGATPASIARQVVGEGLRLGAAGIALGVGLALVFGRALESLLFDVGAVDPVSLVASAVLVGFVTLLASYAPARQAARVDPMAALRGD